MFFANDLLRVIYFICILDYGNDVRQKANLSDFFPFFFLSPKWVTKEAETTGNISNASGPGTANECTVQWWFKKFCKGDRGLEDEEHSGQSLEGD